jgi:hypothetical protein
MLWPRHNSQATSVRSVYAPSSRHHSARVPSLFVYFGACSMACLHACLLRFRLQLHALDLRSGLGLGWVVRAAIACRRLFLCALLCRFVGRLPQAGACVFRRPLLSGGVLVSVSASHLACCARVPSVCCAVSSVWCWCLAHSYALMFLHAAYRLSLSSRWLLFGIPYNDLLPFSFF